MREKNKTLSVRMPLWLSVTAVLTANIICAAIPVYASEVTDLPLRQETTFGGVCIDIPTDDFNAFGFEYGDSVNLVFSNGYTLEDLPYYNGYYVMPDEPLLLGKDGKDYVKACINYGEDLWVLAELTEEDTADISLCRKAEYLDVQEASDISYGDDRADYESDAVFANFRNVTVGDLTPNTLYRSASPCDNHHNRAPYTDALIEEAGVQYVLDLADTEEEINGYLESEDYNSPYFADLYEDGRVTPLALDMKYKSDAFRESLISGLEVMKDMEGPYLVHCLEGKDRTGFVCMLLEALAGASYQEMIDDYMITYRNYYGVDQESDPEKYETIRDINIVPMLAFLAGDDAGVSTTEDLTEQTDSTAEISAAENETEADLTAVDFTDCAQRYLTEGGMSGEEVQQLKACLMTDTATEP